jgi:hypothetical protein
MITDNTFYDSQDSHCRAVGDVGTLISFTVLRALLER